MNFKRSGLRRTSYMLRPRSLSASRPRRPAQGSFTLNTVPPRSTAMTPSSMLESTASCSLCWRRIFWIRSSSCAAMAFNDSDNMPISSTGSSGRRYFHWPLARRRRRRGSR